MSKHPTNKNLTIIKAATFRNLPLGAPRYQGAFEFIEEYLNTNINVMDHALETHARTLAVRIDLRMPPDGNPNTYHDAYITRFIKSLKSKVENYIARTTSSGKRAHYSGVKYIWACEQGVTNRDHYHLVLFLNGDTFRHPGIKRTGESPSNLIQMIIGAWGSALKVDLVTAWDLVNIPPNASYCLRRTSYREDNTVYSELFKRLSYFAKVKSKTYGVARNSYGSSRLSRN